MNVPLITRESVSSKSTLLLALIIFILALTIMDIEHYLSENANFYQQIMNGSNINIEHFFDPCTYFLCGKLNGKARR